MGKKKCEFKVWKPISKKEFIELYKQGKIVSVLLVMLILMECIIMTELYLKIFLI